MFCPMSSVKIKNLDRKNYPGVEREIKKSIKILADRGKYARLGCDVDEIFEWWLSKKSIEDYLASKKQYKLAI